MSRPPHTLRLAAGLTLVLAAVLHGQDKPVEKVAFLGDSMMKLLGHQGSRELARIPGVAVVTNFTSLGSGLARLDAFDWMAQFEAVMKEHSPTLVIIALGTNDRQPMQLDGGRIVRPGEDGWTAEYGRRVGQAMDVLVRGGAVRICWLELPDMKDPGFQADANTINAIVREQAASRPAVLYFGTRRFLSRKPGEFTKYLVGPGGKPLDCRDPDGIHLTRAGADLVVERLMDELRLKSR